LPRAGGSFSLGEVTTRSCPRCHTVLQIEDAGTLVFCWNCGAAQVLVSEELLAQAEKLRRAFDSGGVIEEPGGRPAEATEAVVWKGAIRCAALTGLIAAGLTLLSFALPPLVLLAWFWAVGAPVVALGIYSARFRQTRIQPSFGARLGLLCGLAIFFCMTTVNTVGLLLARFVFHRAAQIDAQLVAFFAQMRTEILAQGSPAQASALAWIARPESRLGLLLAVFGIVLVMYLGLSAAGGAFAALLRSRSESR
jgi:hypothetical protein